MKSYNGVAILTRTKPESVRAGLDDGGEPDEPRLLHVVVGGITILNTYIPQGFEIDSPKYVVQARVVQAAPSLLREAPLTDAACNLVWGHECGAEGDGRP